MVEREENCRLIPRPHTNPEMLCQLQMINNLRIQASYKTTAK